MGHRNSFRRYIHHHVVANHGICNLNSVGAGKALVSANNSDTSMSQLGGMEDEPQELVPQPDTKAAAPLAGALVAKPMLPIEELIVREETKRRTAISLTMVLGL